MIRKGNPASGEMITSRFAPEPDRAAPSRPRLVGPARPRFRASRDGAFLLRIEDIDPGRSRAEHVEAIIEDLAWLGLDWDGEILFQSERLPLYAEALDRLKARPRLSLLLHPRRDRRRDRRERRRAAWPATARSTRAPAGGLVRRGARAADGGRAARLAARRGEGRGRGRPALLARRRHRGSGRARSAMATSSSPARTRRSAIISRSPSTTPRRASPTSSAAATSMPRPTSTAFSRPCSDCRRRSITTIRCCSTPEGRRLAKRHGAPTPAPTCAQRAPIRKRWPRTFVTGQMPAGYSARDT